MLVADGLEQNTATFVRQYEGGSGELLPSVNTGDRLRGAAAPREVAVSARRTRLLQVTASLPCNDVACFVLVAAT